MLFQQSGPAAPTQCSGPDVSTAAAAAAAAAGYTDPVLPAAAGTAERCREEPGLNGMSSEVLHGGKQKEYRSRRTERI